MCFDIPFKLFNSMCDVMRAHSTLHMEKWISIYPYFAPDGVPEVLTGDAHRGARHADHHGHLVVHLEHPVVNVDLVKREVLH